MRTNFTSTDYSVVLRLTFSPVAGADSSGSVTVPATGGTLTMDGTDYTGLSGACILPAGQNPNPGDTSTVFTGTFVLTIPPDTKAALSGAVTGSFDADGVFCPQSFTGVALGPPLGAPEGSFTLLPPPPDQFDVAEGTSSIIIRPH
jgi:hypothetical protein